MSNDADHRLNVESYADRVHGQLVLLGQDVQPGQLRPGVEETPLRVARMWVEELTRGYGMDPEKVLKKFPADEFTGQVIVRDIPFVSTCEHHMLPFSGVAHVGYFPGTYVAGLSKFARLVDGFSRRLQIQERLTQQVHDAIREVLEPRGVIVVMEAEHLCMTVRGVQAPGAKTLTVAVSDRYRDVGEQAKEEFLALIGASV